VKKLGEFCQKILPKNAPKNSSIETALKDVKIEKNFCSNFFEK